MGDHGGNTLNALSTSSVPAYTPPDCDHAGTMNGKIDLFFAYEGRYYILDWKSNFLGDQTVHYTGNGLLEAMEENNYHLQYMIYSVAMRKYLETRIRDYDHTTQFGGVIYIFVRRVRSGTDNGVFTYQPSLEEISSYGTVLAG